MQCFQCKCDIEKLGLLFVRIQLNELTPESYISYSTSMSGVCMCWNCFRVNAPYDMVNKLSFDYHTQKQKDIEHEVRTQPVIVSKGIYPIFSASYTRKIDDSLETIFKETEPLPDTP